VTSIIYNAIVVLNSYGIPFKCMVSLPI